MSRQSILNQTIGVVQQTSRKGKSSDKTGKVSTGPSTASWTHRGAAPKITSKVLDVEGKIRKNTSSSNL